MVALRHHDKNESFFYSFLANDGAEKYWIYENLSSGFTKKVMFRDWDPSPSYIPPFVDRQFTSLIAAYSGAVVVKGDRSVLILGENYVGKTSLMRFMVDNLGWSLLTDSLVMINREMGTCVPYHAPIGLRGEERIKSERIVLSKNLDTRYTWSTETGPVLLVKPEDILRSVSKVPTRITESVVLIKTPKLDGEPYAHLNIPWYGGPTEFYPNPLAAQVFSTANLTIERIAEVIDHE